jgi:hypothetical protein
MERMMVGEEKGPGMRFRSMGIALSIFVAVTAGLLHVASFVTDLARVTPTIFIVALSGIACFGAMLVASGFGRKTRELAKRAPFGEVLRSGSSENFAVVKKVPALVGLGFVGLMFYVAFNFLTFLVIMTEGSPVERDGALELRNHGRFVRTLTPNEFRHLQTLEFRGLSGHFIIFPLAAAIGFAYLVEKPGPKPADPAPVAPRDRAG